jgi:plastocyanin
LLRKLVILVISILLASTPFSLHRVQAEDREEHEEHTVIILDTAYFPQKVVVDTGDTVRFVNKSGKAHIVYLADGNWATKAMVDDQELLVEIEQGMAGTFYGLSDTWIRGQLTQLP